MTKNEKNNEKNETKYDANELEIFDKLEKLDANNVCDVTRAIRIVTKKLREYRIVKIERANANYAKLEKSHANENEFLTIRKS